jgi:hypothetical protein
VSSIFSDWIAERMNRRILPLDDPGQAGVLRYLLSSARRERRRLLRARFASAHGDQLFDGGEIRARRASAMLEKMLGARGPGTIDCARFFSALATRLQIASGVIDAMRTSVMAGTMDATQARALATIIADLVRYGEEAVSEGGSVRVYLAMAVDRGCLIVGVGIDGDVQPVASASASTAMLRARSIVHLMRGEFQRGVDGARCVFGMTFPAEVVDGSAT